MEGFYNADLLSTLRYQVLFDCAAKTFSLFLLEWTIIDNEINLNGVSQENRKKKQEQLKVDNL